MESDRVLADGVEVTGYPDLVQRYAIHGVPKTVVNESFEFVGARPEAVLLQTVQQAAGSGAGIIVS